VCERVFYVVCVSSRHEQGARGTRAKKGRAQGKVETRGYKATAMEKGYGRHSLPDVYAAHRNTSLDATIAFER
jgi:hypothetical protein